MSLLRTPFRGILLLAVCAVISCSGDRRSVEAGSSIIYIVCDALRADHVGCYGYPVDVSPELDALAQTGTLFENHYSQSNATPYSMSSIFTGLYVPRHLYRFPSMTWWQICFMERLPGELWLPRLLSDAGYTTCGINANFILMPEYSEMETSFDTYRFLEPGETVMAYRSAGEVFDTAMEWLQANGERKFFLYLHTMEPHRPNQFSESARHMLREYRSFYPDPADQQRCREIAAYDADVKVHDEEFGRFLDYLAIGGFLDRAVLIFGSDHGESLGDNGLWWHGNTLLPQETHVPFIVAGKGVTAGKRISDLTENVDILPTILEIAGIELPDSALCDGVSLVPLLGSGTKRIKEHGISVASDYRFRSVFTPRYSYICPKRFEPAGIMENLTMFQVLSPFYPLAPSMYDFAGTRDGEATIPAALSRTVSERLETWMIETEPYFDRLRDAEMRRPDAPFEYTVPQAVEPDDAWTRELNPTDNLWTMRFFVSRSTHGMLLKGAGEDPPTIRLVFDAPPIQYNAYLVFGEDSPDTCALTIRANNGNIKEIQYVPGMSPSVPLGIFDGEESAFTFEIESIDPGSAVAIERIDCFPQAEGWSKEAYERKKHVEDRLKRLGYL